MDMLRNLASQAKMAVTGHKEPASPTSPQAAGPSPLTVPQAAAAAAQEADGVPVSPLTGRPLSPRAQEFRRMEGELLEEGPRLL